MPYISQALKSEIMAKLKPIAKKHGIKITGKISDYSTLYITIREGVIDFGDCTALYGMNYYNNASHIHPVLLEINNTIREFVYTVSEDADYGKWPNFYHETHIGTWDKPYKIIPAKLPE